MPRFLFKNANVVLAGQDELATGLNVLVEAERIAAITRDAVEPGNATVVDVTAKTLMPGLIDAHAHITGLSLSPKNLAYPAADLVLASANYLRNCLMAGFTTIREAGPGLLPLLYQPAERRLHLSQGKPLMLATSSQAGWVILFAGWYYKLKTEVRVNA